MRDGAELKDLILPLAVLSTVGMMIFPLPVIALDFLLVCNIAFSLALLVNSVYLSAPEKFTALPTILLLSTLFRLGLNVSTTRQILTTGTAPDVVVGFGEFVVRGNIVVGIVIFCILTLVQFLVVAKGAERVAEVSARFTLDAMPGKQMAIDADVRSGLLSVSEAKEKRLELQRESKLYGSLDGAVKFIKGDTIAGIVITLINICAGFILGVTEHGLSFSEALHRYTIFTIGDGLVSQIPALLVAVAAGISVTQVSSDGITFIGRDVFSQLGKEPQAVGTVGLMLLALGLVPGLPALPFFCMGGCVFFIAKSKSKGAQVLDEEEKETFKPKIYSGLVIALSQENVARLRAAGRLDEDFYAIKGRVYEEMGVLLPELLFDVRETFGESIFIYLHSAMRVELKYVEKENASEYLLAELRNFIYNNLSDFVDDTQTRILLDTNRGAVEDLINSVVPAQLSVTTLSALLKSLVREKISIRDFRLILQAVADYHVGSVDTKWAGQHAGLQSYMQGSLGVGKADLLSEIRIALRRFVSEQFREKILQCWVVSPDLDLLILQSVLKHEPLGPEVSALILQKIVSAYEENEAVVVVSSKFSRGVLSSLICSSGLKISVLSFEEIIPELELEVLGELRLELRSEPTEEKDDFFGFASNYVT